MASGPPFGPSVRSCCLRRAFDLGSSARPAESSPCRRHAEGSRSKTALISHICLYWKNIGRVWIWDRARSNFCDVHGEEYRMVKTLCWSRTHPRQSCVLRPPSIGRMVRAIIFACYGPLVSLGKAESPAAKAKWSAGGCLQCGAGFAFILSTGRWHSDSRRLKECPPFHTRCRCSTKMSTVRCWCFSSHAGSCWGYR